MSHGAKANATLQQIAEKTAKANGLSLVWEGIKQDASSYYHAGSAHGAIDAMRMLGGHDCYVDNNQLVVKQTGKPRKGLMRKLSAATGMIGIPEMTEKGCKVKMLFDPQTQLGGSFEVDSQINPAANGIYEIFSYNFELNTRDTPFYLVVEGKNGSEVGGKSKKGDGK